MIIWLVFLSSSLCVIAVIMATYNLRDGPAIIEVIVYFFLTTITAACIITTSTVILLNIGG